MRLQQDERSMSKRCPRCGETKQLSEFTRNRTCSDGLATYCRSCANTMHAKYYRENRESVAAYKRQYHIEHAESAAAYMLKNRAPKRDVLNAAKTPCPVCGESNKACLDMHHRDPLTKLYTPGDLPNKPMAVLVAELAKCISLCANCHRKYHAGVEDVVSFVDAIRDARSTLYSAA